MRSWNRAASSRIKERSTLRLVLFPHSIDFMNKRVIFATLFCSLQEGKYKQASVQYKKIVSWLEHESGLGEEDEKKAKALRLAAHLNLAMCFLKIKEHNQALENCDKVLLL